jgi:hypothetical protein
VKFPSLEKTKTSSSGKMQTFGMWEESDMYVLRDTSSKIGLRTEVE